MSHLKPYQIFTLLLLLAVILPMTVVGQATTATSPNQKDTAAGTRMATIDEMAKRVDSLQFIVVYNGELLRRNLDSKMMLIFVMLGIIILASMLMYALLKQIQRQRKELEDKLFHQLSTSVADLESKIKHVEAELSPPKPAVRKRKIK
ncbi:MAG: hypothetical protein NTZ35_17035 [Ignavibacteriales bacterium]|nr:hypothetical protein [Ignavibacteriales bacterium]